VTVCALGETVADRFRFVQIHADVIPSKCTDEAVYSAISQFALDDLVGQRILILREISQSFSFVEKLRNAGAVVKEIAVYRAVFENESELPRLRTLLTGGAVDEFIFSSAEDIPALKFLVPGQELPELLSGVKTSANGEAVFQTLQENSLRPLYYHPK